MLHFFHKRNNNRMLRLKKIFQVFAKHPIKKPFKAFEGDFNESILRSIYTAKTEVANGSQNRMQNLQQVEAEEFDPMLDGCRPN